MGSATRLPFFEDLGGGESHSEQVPRNLPAWDLPETSIVVATSAAVEQLALLLPPLPPPPLPLPPSAWLDEVFSATGISTAHTNDSAITGNFHSDVLQEDR